MEKTIEIIVKELREEIAQEIEAIKINGENAVGMKILAAQIARGQCLV